MAPGAGGYYWLRVLDTWGNSSDWHPATDGLYAVASTDPSAMLAQLQNALGMPQLAAELAEPIALLPAMSEDILQRAIDIDALSERVLFERAATDSTLTLDPVTGKFQVLATALVTTDVEARLTQAEVKGDAIAGTLTSTVATVETIGEDLSSTQSQVAQLSDQVALKASSAFVNEAIDAATGALTVDAANAAQALAETAIRQALGLDAATDKELASRARVAVAEQKIATNADAVSAEATARLALAAVVDQQKAALTTEQTVRANADSAEAESRTALAAAVSENAAAIEDEATTSANADAALAERINTVQASLESDVASVQETASASASAITGLQAKWVMKVQIIQNGIPVTAGMEMISGEGGSAFGVLADKILFYQPNGEGAPRQAFTMGTINGVTAFGFDGSAIFDGSITARQINGRGLSIEDDDGEVILSAKKKLDWSHVAGAGRPADNADVTGLNVAKAIANQGLLATVSALNVENISTYVEGAAIKTLLVGAAAMGSANIELLGVKTANIDNLSVNGNKITGVTTGSVHLGPGASVWIPTPSTLGRAPMVGAPSITVDSGYWNPYPQASISINGSGFLITNTSYQHPDAYSSDKTSLPATISYAYL